MIPPSHLLLALVIAIGFCLLLAAGSFASMLLVMFLHGDRNPLSNLGLKRESFPAHEFPKELLIQFWCLALLYLVSLGVLYLPPASRVYVIIGAIGILLSAFIGVAIYTDDLIRSHRE